MYLLILFITLEFYVHRSKLIFCTILFTRHIVQFVSKDNLFVISMAFSQEEVVHIFAGLMLFSIYCIGFIGILGRFCSGLSGIFFCFDAASLYPSNEELGLPGLLQILIAMFTDVMFQLIFKYCIHH